MPKWKHTLVCLLTGVVLALGAAPGFAQSPFTADDWTKGPARVPIGTVAEINLPTGYWCINDPARVQKFDQMSGNTYDSSRLAIIVPDLLRAGNDTWFILCSYDATGHVRDDEKDKLDKSTCDQILSSISSATEAENATRRSAGTPTLHVVGWQTSPFYNDSTKHLTWSILAKDSDGGRVVNYNSRLLGRGGVLSMNMVVDPGQVDRLVPTYENLVGRVSFASGQKYSEFRQGDRVAAYGLTALATGGTAVVLAKNWKGFIAMGAAIVAVLGGIVTWLRNKVAQLRRVPKPAPAAAGPEAAPTIRQCGECGQNNRVQPGRTDACCGRCGATLR